MNSYDKIDSIVKEFLIESGETTNHKYFRYLSYALSIAREWHFDSAQEVKTKVFTMDAIKQIEIPNDFVDWVKIGIQCGDRVKVLSLNEHMALQNNTNDCGEAIAFDSCDCSVSSLPTNFNQFGGFEFMNYQSGRPLYGFGGGYNSKNYFSIYKADNKIQFSSEIDSTNVYMEYISTGFDPCAQTVVNPYAKEMIKAGIDWKKRWHARDPTYRDAKQNYLEARHEARGRIFTIDISDVMGLSRKNFHQAIKN